MSRPKRIGVAVLLAGTIAAAVVACLPGCGESGPAGEASRSAPPPPTTLIDAGAPGDAPRDAALPPLVWMSPTAYASAPACGNRLLPYTFDPSTVEESPDDAFWMMWTAMRSFVASDPTTATEMATAGFTRFQAFDDSTSGLGAFVAGRRDVIVLAFRGTTDLTNWISDFNFPELDGPSSFDVAGHVHEGFEAALASQWPAIESAIRDFGGETIPVWVTGHSLGGALATLAAVRLAHDGFAMGPLYSFAGPRAGDVVFADDVQQRLEGHVYRFVNGLDIVPRVPPSGAAADAAAPIIPGASGSAAAASLLRALNYAHAGTLYTFDMDASAPVAHAPMDESDDVRYWGALATIAGDAGLVGVVLANAAQGARHDPLAYLCAMMAMDPAIP